MLDEGIPAAAIENAGVQAGMPVGPLAVLDETALSLSVQVLEQTRSDFNAEGQSYATTPGELLVERMVKELKRPGRAGGAMQFIYGMGIETFIKRCDQLAAKFGPGFVLTGAVKEAIRKHQPIY